MEPTVFSLPQHDGYELVGTIVRPKKPTGQVVVFVHGFKGFKDWGPFPLLDKHFGQQGFAFARFNFSLNGTTPKKPAEFADLAAFGRNTFTRELDELRQVVDLLTEKENFSNVYLVGHSRGGGIAICHAAKDARIAKTATWAAVADFGFSWTEERIAEWREKGVRYAENARTGQQMPLQYTLYEDYRDNRERLDILANAHKLGHRLLLLHGTEDSSVPFDHALMLKQNALEAKLDLIPAGSHTFGGRHPWKRPTLPRHLELMADKTIEFFQMP